MPFSREPLASAWEVRARQRLAAKRMMVGLQSAVMDPCTFHELLTEIGQAALAAAGALRPTEAEFLSCFELLSKDHPRELARSALETVLLRARAAGKFSRADRMFF